MVRWKPIWKNVVKPIIIFGCFTKTFTDVFYSFCIVSGRSMQPSLSPDFPVSSDIAIVTKFQKRIQHGSIVVFRSPEDPRDVLVKRVIAMEHERIQDARNHWVYVPKGRIWVEGDNADTSRDSNDFGSVSVGLVIGTISAIAWPLSRARVLHPADVSHRLGH
eukprot:Rmarinus@m.26674